MAGFPVGIRWPGTWIAESTTAARVDAYKFFDWTHRKFAGSNRCIMRIARTILSLRGLSDLLSGNYHARRAGAGFGFANQRGIRPSECVPEDVYICAARRAHVCDPDERKLVDQP